MSERTKVVVWDGVVVRDNDDELMTEAEADQLNTDLLEWLRSRGYAYGGAIGWQDEDGTVGGWEHEEHTDDAG